jgi:hypothetical protein
MVLSPMWHIWLKHKCHVSLTYVQCRLLYKIGSKLGVGINW